jgi:HYR domain/GEVED domain
MNVFYFNHNFYKLIPLITIVFCLALSFLQAQPCATPNVGTTSVGEPFSLTIGKGKTDVYFGATVPTYRDILGINFAVYQLENNKLATYLGADISGQQKNALDAFSNIRIFYPSHRDYWNLGDDVPLPFANKDQVPVNNLSNLRLVTDNAGVPLQASGMLGKIIYPKLSTTTVGQIDLVTESIKAPGAYYNVYQNYINNNWIKLRGSFDYLNNSTLPIKKKYSVTLELIPANFAQSTPYNFPNTWFLTDDWGTTDAERKLNAKAYAMMFARTYSPKNSDCPTCPKMVETVEIGNEPWGYHNPSVYHNIVQGFIDGFNAYYGTDTVNKIKLLPASFQAHHAEDPNTISNVSDVNSWKDYVNTRLPASSKCDLAGINLHLYSNTIQGSSLTLDTNYPEKVAVTGGQTTALSRFFCIRNSVKWLQDNTMTNKNLHITEFGWDSDGCTSDRVVGMKTQAIYTIRNTLMMGRYGVKHANLYHIEDDPSVGCGFAYFTSGVFDTKRAPKYIFKALENFVKKTGNTKFHYALREDPNDVHAYILEEADQPKYMVAWLARDINYADDSKTLSQVIALGGADLADGIGALKSINISFNSRVFTPDATLPWYRLDGETSAALNQSTYFVGGQYKLSPVPILIPIKETCTTDNSAPVFTNCPANISQNITDTSAVVKWASPTVTDNCTASPIVTSTDTSGTKFPLGTKTVTYTAKDAFNNTSTCTFTVTLTNPCANDTVKPVFVDCPADITQPTTGGTGIATWTPPSVTDNCTTPSVTSTHASGATFPIGTTTVTYTATDAKNNKGICVFVVTISNPCFIDTIKPVLADCPTDIMQSTTMSSDTVWWTPPTVSDNCTAVPILTSSRAIGSVFPIGVTTVTYTSKDIQNNTATCTFKVTIDNPCLNDTTAPIFLNCPGDITKTITDTAAIATWVLPTAVDNCTESLGFTGTHLSGSSFKIGSTKVTYTATDAKNNTSTCTFNVNVNNPCLNDTVKPVLTPCPANIVRVATGSTATATWTAPTASDNCTASTVASTHSSGATFPIGATTVTYTATDARNNKATCTFVVTVTPQNTNYCASKASEPYQEWVKGVTIGSINNINQTNEGKSINWSVIGYSDFTNVVTNLNRGQTYPLSILPGTSWLGRLTNVYCRVWIDFNGDRIFDDTEKVLEGRALNPFAGSVTIPATAISGSTRMRVSLKWGAMPTSCETFAPGEVEDYLVNISNLNCATDVDPPVFANCPANIVLPTTGTTTTAIATWIAPTATDNCVSPIISTTHNSGIAFPIGVTAVTYTANDAKNNKATCTFTVTVTNPCATDTIKPVLVNCPANISKTTSDTAAIATWTPPTAADNCGTPSVISPDTSGTKFKIGVNTVTYTATDAKNNKATCSFTVTVTNPCSTDTIKPVLTSCPANVSRTITDTVEVVTWIAPTATDNCSTPSVSSTDTSGTKFKIGVNTVTYTATDAKNNKATCSFTVTVINPCATDVVKPVWINCPADISKAILDTVAVVTWVAPTATDNCSTPSVTSTDTSGTKFKIGVTTVIYTATDAKNNQATCSFTITVINPCTNDTTKPVLSNCPANISKTISDTTVIVTWLAPTATDNCSTPLVTSSDTSGTTFKIGVKTVAYTATDDKNNKSTCSFTITVINSCASDTIKPVLLTCPANISRTISDTTVVVTWTAPTATDNCGTPSVTSTDTSGTKFKIGVTIVTYTATDAMNNKSTCLFTVTIINPCAPDTTKPAFASCPDNIAKITSDTALIVTWTAPTATDNCSTPLMGSTHISGALFKVGVTTVTYTAADAKGNKATCAFTVTITNPCFNDTIKPVLANCPTNIARVAIGGSTAIVTWLIPTATDNCSTPSVTSTHNSGAAFPIGTTTVIYTATDSKNNKSTCAFTVTVSPQNANYCGSKSTEPYQEWVSSVRFGTINNTNQANQGKSINWSVIGYSDFTSWVTDVNRGQSYPLSIIPGLSWAGRLANLNCRVWIDFNGDRIFDDTEKVLEGTGQNPFNSNVTIPYGSISGNTRMRVSLKWGGLPTACENFTAGEVEDYTIKIGGVDCTNDVEPPVFANCPANISLSITGATATATWTAPTATDNCTTPVSIISTHNSSAIFPVGVTTVTYTATDARNNSSTCVFTVTVVNPCLNDTTSPVFANCPTNIAKTTPDSLAIATWTPPTATDICSTPSVFSTHNSGATFRLGVTTVTYTATDAKNNKATCSFTVTVTNPCLTDTTKPVIANCPANIVKTTATTSSIATWTLPTATDNCTLSSFVSTHNSGATFPIGVTTVTYTATDAKNNKSTCVFTVTVSNPCLNDTVPPVFANCPTSIIQSTIGTTAIVDWTPPTITDNCSIKPTLSSNYSPGDAFPRGVTTVIYTARDDNNRASTCSFTVTVIESDTNYCSSKAGAPYQDWVSGVTFGTINNTVQANEGKTINWSVIGYSNFTILSTNATRGQTYPLSIIPGASWPGRLPDMYCRVWIDFNNNKTFEANEKVLEISPVAPYTIPFTGDVLIPATATLGNVRMRVAIKSSSLPTACEGETTYLLGEVEDYTISIK